MSNQVIREALERLPQDPGVYLMKDARGKIIYVGKAKRLKVRVASYAREETAPSWYRQKVMAMVAQVEAVEFIVTLSEKEALLLESTLIKRHRPRYNVDLRDDKTYPYFRLSLGDDFPRFSLVRRPDLKDGARYFGPFESAGAARKTLHWLQRIFPLRRCSDVALKGRNRPCLDVEMGRCLAPCAGRVRVEEYQALARQLAAFFAGEGKTVAAELERRMREAAQDEQFEQAAVLRDRWQTLAKTLERQRVSAAEGRDLDVLGLHDDGGAPRLAVLRVCVGRVVASQVHDLGRGAALTAEEAMGQVLAALYQEAAPPPPLVLVSHMPPDPGLLTEVLTELAGHRVELRKPQRGDKKELMELALINAAQPRRAEAAEPMEVLEGLQRKLVLDRLPVDMECVDISHLGGWLTVASVVAMREGALHKAHYRRYKVVTLGPEPDDYAAMAEVVGRRLDGDRPPPDLLVVDGGRGQLAMAVKAMEGLSEEKRPQVIALAKGRPSARGLPPESDRVYLPGRKNPAPLKPRDSELLLLMRLRDEAHRVAVTYHRLLRSKALTRSILEEVPGGVGPGKRARLLKAFGSLAAVKAASAEEMADHAGLDMPTAQRVVAFLDCLDSLSAPK